MNAASNHSVRKATPHPIVRALDVQIAPRPVSPLRRAAIPLAIAAALALGAGTAIAYAASSGESGSSHRSGRSDDSSESGRDRHRSDRAAGADSSSGLDGVLDALGDFVSPPKTETDPIPPSSEIPRPAGTVAPSYDSPRPAGSAASPPPPPHIAPPRKPPPSVVFSGARS
jgi:hypothetical protein